MAAGTIARQLVLEASAAMARLAGCGLVCAVERESGFLAVVKARVAPGVLRVAVGAGRAALAAMHVVRRVTAGAGQWRVLPAVVRVAGRAGKLSVARLQCESGLRVIEAHCLPTGGFMTTRTIRSQLAGVRFGFAMAIHAAGGCLAELAAGGVATGAAHIAMCAIQAKVRLRMIEARWQQWLDAATAPQVFTVTGAALGGCDLWPAAMKAALGLNVGGHILVAGRTQTGLLRAIGAVVAAAAVAFQLRMRGTERAWHQQALQRRP